MTLHFVPVSLVFAQSFSVCNSFLKVFSFVLKMYFTALYRKCVMIEKKISVVEDSQSHENIYWDTRDFFFYERPPQRATLHVLFSLQTLEISGHMKLLHGQYLKGEQTEPLLALFAICCPFGPLPLLDVPPRDYTFKSKHKMDLAPLSMDHRFVSCYERCAPVLRMKSKSSFFGFAVSALGQANCRKGKF